jgi:lysophospholipase L1-like esterase
MLRLPVLAFFLASTVVAVAQGGHAPALSEKTTRIRNGGPVKIVLVGDSTTAPEGGWGPGFCAVMTKNVTCIDAALNGRSSKSFIDEGAWAKALAEHGDYYTFQFGHNDQKPDVARHTDPDTTFAANLKRYIREVRAIGGVPVVLSPLARRTFHDGKPWNDDLKLYAEAARRVAEEENVMYIDLLSLSTAVLAKGTQADADKFNATGHEDARAEQGKGPVDRTHLNPLGQKTFGRIVADALVRNLTELKPDLISDPDHPHD